MKRFGGMFRIGVSTIAAAALLAGTAASPAAAAAGESGLVELYERIGLLPAILALLVAAAAAGVARSRASGRQGSATTRPTLRWLPPQPAYSHAILPAGSDVVGALLHAASTDVGRQQAAKPGQPKRPFRTAGAELAGLKPPVEAPNKPTAEAEAEAEVLKRKGSASEKLALRASERGVAPKSDVDMRTKEQLASTDGILLKEKLAPNRQQKRTTGPGTNERPGQRTKRGARRESALRPVSASGAESDARVLAATRENSMRECEVDWWRGYMKSAFFAIETSSTGSGRTVAWSPYFRWRKRDVPRETPEAAAALRSLVESLQCEGWIVAGRREEWFRVTLVWPSSVDTPGTINGPQTHIG